MKAKDGVGKDVITEPVNLLIMMKAMWICYVFYLIMDYVLLNIWEKSSHLHVRHPCSKFLGIFAAYLLQSSPQEAHWLCWYWPSLGGDWLLSVSHCIWTDVDVNCSTEANSCGESETPVVAGWWFQAWSFLCCSKAHKQPVTQIFYPASSPQLQTGSRHHTRVSLYPNLNKLLLQVLNFFVKWL